MNRSLDELESKFLNGHCQRLLALRTLFSRPAVQAHSESANSLAYLELHAPPMGMAHM
jgi:hypothetical protein